MEKKPDILETIRREGFEPKQKGRSFWLSCPFHEDRNPSFKIDPERQTFICFGCNARGDSITFVQKLHNLTFKEALIYLGLDRNQPVRLNPQEQTKRDLLKAFRAWERDYYRQLSECYRDFHAIAKDFKTIEEVEYFAEDFDLMPVIESHMDILFNGSEEQKYRLYCLVEGKENGSD